MPISIVVTPGAVDANSYASEIEFIARAATRLNVPLGTTVTGSTCSELEKTALIEAQRELTTLPWKAGRSTSTQALAWPRLYAENPDAPALLGITAATDFWFDNDEVPQRVKDAQIELAFEFIRAGTTDLAAVDQNQGIIEKTVDVLTTRWESAQDRPAGLGRFPRIMALLAPLLDASATGVDLLRV